MSKKRLLIFFLVFVLWLVLFFYLSLKIPNENNLISNTQVSGISYIQKEEVSNIPVRLLIPKININAKIEQVGLMENGEMGVPKGPNDVVWFTLGPKPGEIGDAVIAGHRGWRNVETTVFDNLYKLKKGDKIYIENDNKEIVSFVVREMKSYETNADTTEVFKGNDGLAHLNLITCDGYWDSISRTSIRRLVVFTDKEIK